MDSGCLVKVPEKTIGSRKLCCAACRTKKNADRRSVWFKWKQNDLADGYVIYFGKSPDKLYGSIMVYGKNEYYFTGADKSDAYYFQIEAFNANGISNELR